MDYQTWVLVDDDEMIVYIANNYYPEDVFSIEALEGWARENGFIKPEDE